MKTYTYAEFGANLDDILNRVEDDREPVAVHLPGQGDVVIIRLDDYTALRRNVERNQAAQRDLEILAATEGTPDPDDLDGLARWGSRQPLDHLD